MRCQNCGREMNDGARFCISCGAEHDMYGQLVNGGKGNVNYNDMSQPSDKDSTMSFGATGFKQYVPEENEQQNYQEYQEEYDKNVVYAKKKISPIIIICPIIIIGALAFSLFGNKNKSKKTSAPVKQTVEQTQETVKETIREIIEESKEIVGKTKEVVKETVVATVSTASAISDKKGVMQPKAYWSEDGEFFYRDGAMQVNQWIGDYYVGADGKKVRNRWVEEKFYVDDEGKKLKNEWIHFDFIDPEGNAKSGYYYLGEDGEKVKNQTIDGKYIDNEGCYFESEEAEKENTTEKKTEKIALEEATTQKETTQQVVTTVPSETIPQIVPVPQIDIVPQVVAPAALTPPIEQLTPVAPTEIMEQTTASGQSAIIYMTNETTAQQTGATQVIAPMEPVVSTVTSDTNGVVYQKVTANFPDKKITKMDAILINDATHTNLMNNVNEWSNNRKVEGISAGEVISNDSISATYEINVERNDGMIFSLYETRAKLDNNVAYERVKEGKTWDAMSGQPLELEEVFADKEKFEEFTEKVIKKFKSYKNSMDEEIYQEIIENEDDSVYDYCTWYMTNTGITLVFNANDVDTEGVDGLTFSFTYADTGSKVNKLLQKKYRR